MSRRYSSAMQCSYCKTRMIRPHALRSIKYLYYFLCSEECEILFCMQHNLSLT